MKHRLYFPTWGVHHIQVYYILALTSSTTGVFLLSLYLNWYCSSPFPALAVNSVFQGTSSSPHVHDQKKHFELFWKKWMIFRLPLPNICLIFFLSFVFVYNSCIVLEWEGKSTFWFHSWCMPRLVPNLTRTQHTHVTQSVLISRVPFLVLLFPILIYWICERDLLLLIFNLKYSFWSIRPKHLSQLSRCHYWINMYLIWSPCVENNVSGLFSIDHLGCYHKGTDNA